MEQLHDALIGAGQRGDAANVLKDEARRLCQQIVAFTPPLGPGGSNTGAQKAGWDAIKKQLGWFFRELHPDTIDEFGGKFGLGPIHTYLTGKGGKTEVFIDHISPGWEDDMSRLHKAHRNRRGRIPITSRKQETGKWRIPVAVPTGSKVPYIAKVLPRVGRFRASLAKGLPAMGGKVPHWISRHFGSVDKIALLNTSRLNDPKVPSVVFGSRAPGCNDAAFVARVKDAVNFRRKKMARRLKLILSGYSKDMKARMRIRNRGKYSDEPEPAPL